MLLRNIAGTFSRLPESRSDHVARRFVTLTPTGTSALTEQPCRGSLSCSLFKSELTMTKTAGKRRTPQCGQCEQDILSGTAMALVPCRIRSVPHIDNSGKPFRVEWEVRVR